jgi:hypothetical protein
MEQTSTFDSSNIVLLGDHGSRIGFLEPKESTLERVTKRDVLNTFAALLAVKNGGGYSNEIPKTRGEYVVEQVAVAEVIAKYFGIPYNDTRKNTLHLPGSGKGEWVPVLVPDFYQWKGREGELAELQPVK